MLDRHAWNLCESITAVYGSALTVEPTGIDVVVCAVGAAPVAGTADGPADVDAI